jgi:hypothetical protein
MPDANIGHNQPPPFEFIGLHIEDLFQLVSDTLSGVEVVQNDEQDATLDGLLDDFRKAKKTADEYRAAEKLPHDKAAKEVQAKWKPLLERCDMAAAEIKAKLTPYRAEKIAAREKAVQQAREEADAKQRAAQEALRQSDDLEARFAAEEQLKQATKLTAAANQADRSATGLRTSFVAEITDRRAALNHYIKINPDAFTALIQELADKDARSEATRRDIPGILFSQKREAV